MDKPSPPSVEYVLADMARMQLSDSLCQQIRDAVSARRLDVDQLRRWLDFGRRIFVTCEQLAQGDGESPVVKARAEIILAEQARGQIKQGTFNALAEITRNPADHDAAIDQVEQCLATSADLIKAADAWAAEGGSRG